LLVLGEEAQENGLKSSLLERLQSHYKKIGDKTATLQASLQTNFRCHKHILSFASELFYGSHVKTSRICKRIQPHPDFPYPLVFVCSSKDKISNYESSVNEEEAYLLLNKLVELSTCLQDSCGGTICVLSSSRGQVHMSVHKVVYLLVYSGCMWCVYRGMETTLYIHTYLLFPLTLLYRSCLAKGFFTMVQNNSIALNIDVKSSPNAKDIFWPISSLISCAGVTRSVSIACHARSIQMLVFHSDTAW